jgi:hypothetical protein
MPSPRPTGPAKCPKCGCPTVLMQVVAWAVFKDGEYQTVDLSEYIEVNPDAAAACDNEDCGHEWWTPRGSRDG